MRDHLTHLIHSESCLTATRLARLIRDADPPCCCPIPIVLCHAVVAAVWAVAVVIWLVAS